MNKARIILLTVLLLSLNLSAVIPFESGYTAFSAGKLHRATHRKSLAAFTAKPPLTVPNSKIKCVKDESNGNQVLFNLETGGYIFCCSNGITKSGIAEMRQKGCIITLQQKTGVRDHRLLVTVDICQQRGNGTLQSPPGRLAGTIMDRNTANSTFTCAAGGALASEFDLFVNPDDPLLIRAETVFGDMIEYFGQKDAQGFATALTSVRVQAFNGNATTILLDEQARPTQIAAFNGVVFNILWQTNTSILLTAISPNGSIQVNVPIDLATQAMGQASVSMSTELPIQALPTNRQPRAGAPTKLVVTPLKSSSGDEISSQGSGSSTSLVTVKRCNAPVNDAIVNMVVAPVSGPAFSLPANLSGPGVYSVSIPSTPSNAGTIAQDICESVAGVLDFGCTALELVEGHEILICTTIAAAIDVALGGPTGEAVPILAACESGFAAATLYCSTLGASPGPGGPSLLEFICGGIDDVIDRFFSGEVFLLPSARIAGAGNFGPSGGGQFAPGSGPFPNFTIDAGSAVQIASFTTNPADPAPFQGYVASALVRCASPNTSVRISIVGTDGYTDSTTAVISGDSTVTLFVPGGAAGVVDRVTVEISGGPSRAIVLVF